MPAALGLILDRLQGLERRLEHLLAPAGPSPAPADQGLLTFAEAMGEFKRYFANWVASEVRQGRSPINAPPPRGRDAQGRGAPPDALMAALATPRLADAAAGAREEALLRGANLAAMDLGRKLEDRQADHLVAELPAAAASECPNIRLGEIGIAMRRGAMGHFGPVYALSLSALVGFLKSHMASPERGAAVERTAQRAAALLPERTMPTGAEMLARDRELLCAAFERWRRTGRYDDHGGYAYRVATERLGLLPLSEERKLAYLQEGGRLAAAGARADRRAGRARRERIAAEATALEPGTQGRALAAARARRIALHDWFAELEANGTDIGELIQLTSDS